MVNPADILCCHFWQHRNLCWRYVTDFTEQEGLGKAHGGVELTFPPMKVILFVFPNHPTSVKIIYSVLSEMEQILTLTGRQKRKRKGISHHSRFIHFCCCICSTCTRHCSMTEELRHCCIQVFRDEIQKNKGADKGIKSQQRTVMESDFPHMWSIGVGRLLQKHPSIRQFVDFRHRVVWRPLFIPHSIFSIFSICVLLRPHSGSLGPIC